ILANAREVVCANPRAWDALLRTSTEVALRFTDRDVVANLGRCATVEMGGASGRAAGGVADHAQLLTIGIASRRVAVVEDHRQVAVGHRDGVRALIEIACVEGSALIEEVAKRAKRRGAADLLRSEERRVGQG